ncbi:MAG: isovaleryl-CoA dehydrogenase [Kiloniellales bacterium]
MMAGDQSSTLTTHEVENQPPPLADYDAFRTDRCLVEAVKREGADWAESRLSAFGKMIGSAAVIELGDLANRFPPQLRTHDRFGHRIDEIEYHTAWHELMALGMEHELHALPWNEPRPGSHVARAALAFLMNQAESGVCCPFAMSCGSIVTLRHQEDLAAEWEPRLRSTRYDKRCQPADEKTAATIGMAMTEKQGGSDVRANTTRAVPVEAEGSGAFLLTGHKWFFSAPMSDAFLTLAYSPGGLSCFLVPRWLPDGSRNRFFIQRLKDKLGNRSNASSEIEYHDTWARLVGEEGRGVPTIIEMVQQTRLDAAISSAALMRQALVQAVHHATHRSAFQRRLIDQALMQNVLADLAIESEAATILSMRLARAFDESASDERARAFARIGTAIAKYWTCKRAPSFVYEALECLGGNGYVEESIMPRLYREAPINSIWEGCGNVICLDILRTLRKEPVALEALLAELRAAEGADRRLDAAVRSLAEDLRQTEASEAVGRRLAERLALALQAALLFRGGNTAVADAFCASRLAGDWGRAYGTLPDGLALARIVERARPSPA